MGQPALKVVASVNSREARAEKVGAVEAAALVSRRELLAALRDKIASDIDNGVPARDLASLSKRLLDITKELENLEKSEEGDDLSRAAATPDAEWSD